MSDIDLHLEIPKTITLAPVALRVQSCPYDDLFYECTNEFAAVGGVLVMTFRPHPVCIIQPKPTTSPTHTHTHTYMQLQLQLHCPVEGEP